jgi:hypothetical protein
MTADSKAFWIASTLFGIGVRLPLSKSLMVDSPTLFDLVLGIEHQEGAI